MQQSTAINPINKQQSITIQWLKGIAILCVILAHTCPRGTAAVIFRPWLNSSVPLFIFLSAYLTRIEGRNWYAFYKKRIIRVLIPYVIWTVFYCYQAGVIGRLYFKLLTSSSAGHLYYIFVYVQLVLLTPLFAMLARSRHKYNFLIWIISPIFVACYIYLPLMIGKPVDGYLYIVCSNICLGFILYFYLGLLLGNRILVKKFSVNLLAILFVAAVVLQIGEAYILMKVGSGDPGNPGLTNVLTSFFCCLLAYAILEQGGFKNCNKFLVLLGNYSFGLYLSHVLVKRILQTTTFYDSIPYIANSALVLLISLFVCYVGDKVLGKRISRWLGFR